MGTKTASLIQQHCLQKIKANKIKVRGKKNVSSASVLFAMTNTLDTQLKRRKACVAQSMEVPVHSGISPIGFRLYAGRTSWQAVCSRAQGSLLGIWEVKRGRDWGPTILFKDTSTGTQNFPPGPTSWFPCLPNRLGWEAFNTRAFGRHCRHQL